MDLTVPCHFFLESSISLKSQRFVIVYSSLRQRSEVLEWYEIKENWIQIFRFLTPGRECQGFHDHFIKSNVLLHVSELFHFNRQWIWRCDQVKNCRLKIFAFIIRFCLFSNMVWDSSSVKFFDRRLSQYATRRSMILTNSSEDQFGLPPARS